MRENPSDDEDGIYDVLARHRATNRAIRAPTQEALASGGDSEGDDEDENEDKDKDEDGDEESSTTRHAPDTSMTPRPTTIRYYRNVRGWPNVFVRAKQRFAKYVALINGFPSRSAHLEDAEAILAQAVVDFEERGGEVDQGLALSCSC